MKKEIFGFQNGKAVELYTLENEKASVSIMTRGATVVDFTVSGTSIVGGFDTFDEYLQDDSHQGAIIGRVANRVAKAQFEMDGKVYHLPANNGVNCLHGGDGFDHRIWNVESVGEDSIVLSYVSADGEEGFPNALAVKVTYTLIGAALKIDYEARPDGKTPIALTNHAYFNLDGFGKDVLNHVAVIHADKITEVDDALIPNGNHPDVKGTPFDFNAPHTIGERIGGAFTGYDHNYVLNRAVNSDKFGKVLTLCAAVNNGKLQMNVYTDQPGVQFYTANFLGGKPDFKGGISRVRHGAFCLETQTEPDCVNHGVGFYDKGQTYRHTTVYEVEKIG